MKATATAGDERPRFLSEADCHDVMQRLSRMARSGYTSVQIASTWRGNLRWARNHISTAGEVRDNDILIMRTMNGADGFVRINETTDEALVAAVRQAERLASLRQEKVQYDDFVARLPLEPGLTHPQLFSENTYHLDADQRATAGIALARTAADAGMLSAGDIEVLARSIATLDTRGRVLYFQYTHAQYRVTVRTPKGTGSGWAGLDHYDWSKIDGTQLTGIALDKCLKSQNPVRVEPGRYTTILEPQAVSDFVGQLMGTVGNLDPIQLNSNICESSAGVGPFNKERCVEGKSPGYTHLGERVIDARLSISADPMDPELGFPPFGLMDQDSVGDNFTVPIYHPVTWIDKGVLTNLAYSRRQAIYKGRNTGLPNSGAFRMRVDGPTSTIEEMIASTKRGVLVTRFDQLTLLHFPSQLYRGYTRDGLWFIENGKITKPIKNFAFTESIMFALNNVEQIGVPQRAYHGGIPTPYSIPQPHIVPALKIRDFSFTALTDAV